MSKNPLSADKICRSNPGGPRGTVSSYLYPIPRAIRLATKNHYHDNTHLDVIEHVKGAGARDVRRPAPAQLTAPADEVEHGREHVQCGDDGREHGVAQYLPAPPLYWMTRPGSDGISAPLRFCSASAACMHSRTAGPSVSFPLRSTRPLGSIRSSRSVTK